MGDRKSDLKNTRFYGLKLSKSTDGALIAKLDSQESVQGYIKGLIRADIVKGERKTMKQISLDNGRTYLDATEAIKTMQEQAEESGIPFGKIWESVAYQMDDDIRETVHMELAPCTEEEFLRRYLELSPEDLIIG